MCLKWCRLYDAGTLDTIVEYTTMDRYASGSIDNVAQFEHFCEAFIETSGTALPDPMRKTQKTGKLVKALLP